MNDTPEQQNSMKSWAVRRDEILRDIANLKVEEGRIIASNTDGNEAFSEVQGRITHAIGRLDELDRLEETRKISLSKDIAELEVKKTQLQGDVSAAQIEYDTIKQKGADFLAFVGGISDFFTAIYANATDISGTLGDIKEKALSHSAHVDTMIANIETSTDKLVEKNQKNVELTDIVLGSIHKYIFELQKPIPVRRVEGA